MIDRIDALSMSWRVARAIREDGWTGEVLAVYPRSLYVCGEDGEIYAVVQESVGNGPFSLVIPGLPPEPFRDLSPGSGAASGGAHLALGESLTVGLDRATLWDPKAYPALGADPDLLQRALAELCRVVAQRSPQQSLARLLPHLEDEDLPRALQGVAHFPDPAGAGVVARTPR